VGADPQTGMPILTPGILGYRNVLAEMDVDIEVDTQPASATVQQEAFEEIIHLVGMSPVYQQQISLKQLIQLSPIPHKRSVLDAIDQASQQQQADQAEQKALGQQHAQAKIAETQARTGLHAATGFAKSLDALTYAHQAHADSATAGLEAGLSHGQQQQTFQNSQDAQESDQQHAAAVQAMDGGQSQQPVADQGGP
jgi:hypothetical protein